MLGIVIELLLSFLLLKYLGDQHLNALGLFPSTERMFHLLLGFCIPLIFVTLLEFVKAYLVHNPYHVNDTYGFSEFIKGLAYIIRAVVFEELIFRGAILVILMKQFGVYKAIIISTVAFGIYHWFSWGAFGNPMAMVVIFLTTASFGYVLSLSFAKTGSMYLGFGMHFGNNLANMLIFSKDKSIGVQWLQKTFEHDLLVPYAVISIIVIVFHYIGIQVLCFGLVKWIKTKNVRTINP